MMSDFDSFKKECLRLQKVLNLGQYALSFFHKKLPNGVTAQIEYSSTEFWANLIMTKKHWQKLDPKTDAKHEMSHLFLARLRSLASARFINEEELDLADETIARIMEKVL